MSDAPVLSVVIRCRNEVAHIGPVLEALGAQAGVPAMEILALDSGSTDGTLDVLARHPVRVEHLPAGDFTFGRALNEGARRARGALLVHLSAHCRPLATDWLARLTAPFADAAVVATFGRQAPIPGVNPIEAIAMRQNFPPAGAARVLFSNANGAVRRAAVLARPWDEEIPAAEDHLWAAGARPPERVVYVPEAAVEHSHPMTLDEWRFRFYINGLAAEYARRHGIALPWADDTLARVVGGRAGRFLWLAGTLARHGEVRALARLPSYAWARTVCYARGVRDGARRWAG
jgi:glycosyltransferase involved in cell wall biosynthesis